MALTLTPRSYGALHLTAPYPLSEIGWFNVKDYGAVGDGVADDTTAITAAVTAATAVKGRVYGPPGIYSISSEINIPNGVNIAGAGNGYTAGPASTTFKCTAAGAGISFGQTYAGAGGTVGGASGHFTIDGNNVSTYPLKINRVVCREFTNIGVINQGGGTGAGVWIREAQNCTFQSMMVSSVAGDCYRLDGGCGGNAFFRCNGRAFGRYGVLVTQSYATPQATTGTYNQPQNNQWYSCVVEASIDNVARTVVRHEAGLNNVFYGCNLVVSPGGVVPCIHILSDATAVTNGSQGSYAAFDRLQAYGGDPFQTTCFRVDNGANLDCHNAVLIGSFLYFLELNGSPSVHLADNRITWGSASGQTQHAWNGTATFDTAVSADTYGKNKIFRSAASDNYVQGYVENDTGIRWRLTGTTLSFGDGAGVIDTNITRSAGQMQLTSAFGVVVAKTDGTGWLGLNKQTAIPGNAVADACRLYLQDNGAGKMQLCVKFPTGAAQILATEP